MPQLSSKLTTSKALSYRSIQYFLKPLGFHTISFRAVADLSISRATLERYPVIETPLIPTSRKVTKSCRSHLPIRSVGFKLRSLIDS